MTQRVLIVEDNPDLRRHLQLVLEGHGFEWLQARNEDEAYDVLTNNVFAVVADIDLSETGGRVTGGIVLAEWLAKHKAGVPIVLISQTPWFFLPPVGTEEYEQRTCDLRVVRVLDRNDSSFWKNLTECLSEVRSKANLGEKDHEA